MSYDLIINGCMSTRQSCRSICSARPRVENNCNCMAILYIVHRHTKHLNSLTLYLLNLSEGTKTYLIFYVIPPHWQGTCSWNSFSYKTRTYLFLIVNIMVTVTVILDSNLFHGTVGTDRWTDRRANKWLKLPSVLVACESKHPTCIGLRPELLRKIVKIAKASDCIKHVWKFMLSYMDFIQEIS